MARVACIDKATGKVVNVIIAESIGKIPDVVGVDEKGKPISKDTCNFLETEIVSAGDWYIPGQGFYRKVADESGRQL